MRPANFPNRVRARREAALKQREAELTAWNSGGHPDYSDKEWAECSDKDKVIEHKVKQAEADIEHLKKKVA